jgi:hypothetical protein
MKTMMLGCLILMILGNCSLTVGGQDYFWFYKGESTTDLNQFYPRLAFQLIYA